VGDFGRWFGGVGLDVSLAEVLEIGGVDFLLHPAQTDDMAHAKSANSRSRCFIRYSYLGK
jgi:hypothetical protein